MLRCAVLPWPPKLRDAQSKTTTTGYNPAEWVRLTTKSILWPPIRVCPYDMTTLVCSGGLTGYVVSQLDLPANEGDAGGQGVQNNAALSRIFEGL